MTKPKQTQPPDETPEPDFRTELQALLDRSGLVPVIVAVGKRSGAQVPIVDFLPDTHDVTVVFVRKQDANTTG